MILLSNGGEEEEPEEAVALGNIGDSEDAERGRKMLVTEGFIVRMDRQIYAEGEKFLLWRRQIYDCFFKRFCERKNPIFHANPGIFVRCSDDLA